MGRWCPWNRTHWGDHNKVVTFTRIPVIATYPFVDVDRWELYFWSSFLQCFFLKYFVLICLWMSLLWEYWCSCWLFQGFDLSSCSENNMCFVAVVLNKICIYQSSYEYHGQQKYLTTISSTGLLKAGYSTQLLERDRHRSFGTQWEEKNSRTS